MLLQQQAQVKTMLVASLRHFGVRIKQQTAMHSSISILFVYFPLKTSTLRNKHLLTRRSIRGADTLDGLDKLLALDHFAEDGVLAVEMRGGDRGDEELRSIAKQNSSSARRRGRLN